MIATSPIYEKRKDQRIEKNVPIKICQEEGDVVTETANISRSGAYCQVNKYIEPMTKMKVHLLLPIRKNGKNAAKKITCEGVIVRSEPASKDQCYNIAIFFSNISQRNLEAISDYVNVYLGIT